MADIEGQRRLAGLLARVAGGDQRAFADLYQSTSGKMFSVVLRICPNQATAEDVLQDAYATIWRQAGQYQAERASPIAWMATIARNKAIDRRRLWGERLMANSLPPDETLPDGGTNPFQQTAQSEELSELERCLSGLTDEQRDMVLLAYYEGWSRDELASKFDRPVNTVKTLLRRSLLQLRTCLDGRS